jgi:uncharacterized protein YigE (DUF2233 family)
MRLLGYWCLVLNSWFRAVIVGGLGFQFGGAQETSWKLTENTRGEGVPTLIKKVATSSQGDKVTLTLVEFSSKSFTLKVVDQGSKKEARKFANLREAMEKNGCVAGVNGGFFGVDFLPLGAVYENGTQLAPYVDSNRKGLASGVIWSGTGGIYIVRRQDFKAGPAVQQAIQTGPMLIFGSAIVPGLSKEKPRPRSFVLTDWKGTWMLGTSSFISLAGLAEVLDSPDVFKEMVINRAINLDGGSSTGFYFKPGDGKVIYNAEYSPVRNFLGIVPR